MCVFSELALKAFKLKQKTPFSNNEIIEFRYRFIEDFDMTYKLDLISHKYRQETKPEKPIITLAIHFVKYIFIFDDRRDKLEFCRKFIKRVEEDKEGFFENEPELKAGLLIIFKVEWDSLRSAMKISSDKSDILDRIKSMEFHFDSISSIEMQLTSILEIAKSNKK
jgi:hypothetical protein